MSTKYKALSQYDCCTIESFKIPSSLTVCCNKTGFYK